MNRDWFARTQPETDGKLEALRQYPPHAVRRRARDGRPDYFFPPNADPIYHETPDTVASTGSTTLYGPAIGGEFDRAGHRVLQRRAVRLLRQGYGDTVPDRRLPRRRDDLREGATTTRSPTREQQHFTSSGRRSAAGAAPRVDPAGLAREITSQAYQEGVAGQLEPNASSSPGTTVPARCRTITVRGYFLRNDPRSSSGSCSCWSAGCSGWTSPSTG